MTAARLVSNFRKSPVYLGLALKVVVYLKIGIIITVDGIPLEITSKYIHRIAAVYILNCPAFEFLTGVFQQNLLSIPSSPVLLHIRQLRLKLLPVTEPIVWLALWEVSHIPIDAPLAALATPSTPGTAAATGGAFYTYSGDGNTISCHGTCGGEIPTGFVALVVLTVIPALPVVMTWRITACGGPNIPRPEPLPKSYGGCITDGKSGPPPRRWW